MKTKSEQEQRDELRNRMSAMIKRANTLRDEAAQKMDGVPKAYELIYGWKEIRVYLMCVLMGSITFMFLIRFMYWIEHESYIMMGISTAVLTIITIIASAYHNQYKVENETKSYYVNEVYYDALKKELQRLTDGIAEYDRQFEE